MKVSPLAGKKYVTTGELADLPLILPRRIQVQSELASWFGDYYKNLNIMFTSNLSTNGAVMVSRGLAACGNSASQTRQPSTEEKLAASTVNSGESAENSTDAENMDTSEGQTNQLENPENPDISEEQGIKVLLAYFSATNTTEGVAEHIVNVLNADIYEIVPEEPYTDADLNYNDNNSRTTIEMNDPDARPAISGSVKGMEEYDIVFIGFPNMEQGFCCV